MRILHVVTLISEDGAYGGPARVASNQADALAVDGHDVTIVAAGPAQRSRASDVTVRLFEPRKLLPRIGFAGLSSPGLLRWIIREGRGFDVVHVHLARDLVTLPAAILFRALGVRVVVQTHGMIDASDNALAKPLDALLTKRVLRSASALFYLTPRERSDLIDVAGPGLALVALTNGVPELPERVGSDSVEVLFLARLHSRKRPELFAQMAEVLVPEFPTAAFTLVGPDEGEGAQIVRAQHVRWEGAIAPSETAARMRRASVYVLPSVDEPYPMAVLEAMAVGLPVVVTDSCGLAPEVASIGCGMVVPGDDVDALVGAVRKLLSSNALRDEMGTRGRAEVRRRFGTAAVARTLEQHYEGEHSHV
ncbi:glycosyltransferase [Rhodococcus sp. 06-418-1B]|nr:glycosyltransferase [Rhodococcus sp. 06-418-1B]OZC78495.1 glycosyltransferase [Rhodococcus sp. 06-418-1B]